MILALFFHVIKNDQLLSWIVCAPAGLVELSVQLIKCFSLYNDVLKETILYHICKEIVHQTLTLGYVAKKTEYQTEPIKGVERG